MTDSKYYQDWFKKAEQDLKAADICKIKQK
ncbi:hypothetical protein TthWC1_0678 [Thermoanaerobacter thermohydrosulfuricus WC1]|uniref:Uncharacterized protein n=1 Tax=Thermoanaerobacter thermohydrosulfuricus WC1 TaxID=1198630 RepID=M8CZJ6_THETY|nr:hypothetical protein TthWC1_0678 [Thermoanaerobacter thermohydrosulfuricus WC1]